MREEKRVLICFPYPDSPRHTIISNWRPSAHKASSHTFFILLLPLSSQCFVLMFGGVCIHFIAIDSDLLPNKLSFSDTLCAELRNTAPRVFFFLSCYLYLWEKILLQNICLFTNRFSSFHIGYTFSCIVHVLVDCYYFSIQTSIPLCLSDSTCMVIEAAVNAVTDVFCIHFISLVVIVCFG